MNKRKAVLSINGVSKLPSDWGVEFGSMDLVKASLAVDSLVFTVATNALSSTPIAVAGDAVKLYEQEFDAQNNAVGDPVCVFAGEVIETNPVTNARSSRRKYECANAWMALERVTYYQNWASIAGSANGSTLVALFVNTIPITDGGYTYLPGTRLISVGRQIADCIEWLKTEVGASLQLGQALDDVEPKSLYIPSTQKFDLKVWEALRIGLEKAPDVVSWFDYTTDPPSVWFKRRADLQEVTLTLGEDIQAASPTSRNSLVVPAVHLQYLQSNTVDGSVTGITVTHDYWPADAWDDTKKRLNNAAMLGGALTQTVNLEGSSTTLLSVGFSGQTIAPTDVEWWKTVAPKLRNAQKVASVGFANQQIFPRQNTDDYWNRLGWTCEDLNATTLAEADYFAAIQSATWYRVTEGQVPQWLIADGTYAIRRFRFTAMVLVESVEGKKRFDELIFECLATTCPPGDYTTVSGFTAAEQIPTALAKEVQTALGQTYFDGGLTIKEQFPTGQVRLGQVVNLVGKDGETEFAAMRALVQRVAVNYDTGETRVDFGLPRWLGAAELVDFFRISRTRFAWFNASAMGDATRFSGGGGELDASDGVGNENSAPGNDTDLKGLWHSETDKTNRVKAHGGDASVPPNVSIQWSGNDVAKLSAGSDRGILSLYAGSDLKALLEAATAGGKLTISGNGSVEIDGALANGKRLYVRECEVCVNNVVKKAMVVMSDPY